MRNRNKDGRYRKKCDDTKIETIEKTYRLDLDVRGDMELGTYRKLNAALKKNVRNNLMIFSHTDL